MEEWLSYRPRDFLMFSPEVYWRLFALQNDAFRPLPLVAPLLAAAALAGRIAGVDALGRVLWGLLGAAWAFAGWSFVGGRYAEINWAMEPAAWIFHAQAALLALTAAGVGGARLATLSPPRRLSLRGGAGLALAIHAIAIHPFVPLATGRPPDQAEIVGLAPDPTAMLTLGLLLLAPPARLRPWLAVAPLLWLAASAATLHVMGAPERLAPAAAALVYLVAEILGGGRSGRRPD